MEHIYRLHVTIKTVVYIGYQTDFLTLKVNLKKTTVVKRFPLLIYNIGAQLKENNRFILNFTGIPIKKNQQFMERAEEFKSLRHLG